MEEANISTSHKLLKLVPKLSNYMIGFTILCYGTGFAITNLYLGSMGIVTFDLLRTRYILAGLLFLFFLSAIGYLVIGLYQTLRKNYQLPRLKIIGKVLWFSLLNLSLLRFIIPAIGLFAGSYGAQSYYIPQTTQPDIHWSDWLNQEPLKILRSTADIFLIMLGVVILFISIFIIINPKDNSGKRMPRRQIIREISRKIKASKWDILGSLIGMFVYIYLLFLLINLISFFLTGNGSTNTKLTMSLPSDWVLFFNTIAIIYSFIAVYLTFKVLFHNSSEASSNDDTVFIGSSSIIYLIAIIIILVVPLYAIKVYPALPQQIGGGHLIRVEVLLSDFTIDPQFKSQTIETYLIDRTSKTSFFLLQNTSQLEYKIIEIQNGDILSITYAHSP